jgi:hypothetical protein
MKKILFICDGDHFSKGAFQFINLIHENEPVLLKGLFFSPIELAQLIAVSYMPNAEPFAKMKAEEQRLVEQSKHKFIEACNASKIKYHLVDAEEDWNKELFVKESRFADLVVLSDELFRNSLYNDQPNFFMQEALRGAECPVLVVPDSFQKLDRIAAAYDSTKDSVFALKQFAYLFGQFTDLPTEFVYVKNETNEIIPNLPLLEEYASLHFNCLATAKLRFDAHKQFLSWLESKKNVLLITGSFGRSAVSNLLRPSFADHIIHAHPCPVFIAHHA